MERKNEIFVLCYFLKLNLYSFIRILSKSIISWPQIPILQQIYRQVHMSRSFPKTNAALVASPNQLQQYQELAYVTKGLVSRDIIAHTLDKDTLLMIRQSIPNFVQSGLITNIQAFKSRGIVWAELRQRELEAKRLNHEAHTIQFCQKMIKIEQERVLKRKLQKQQENSSFLDKFVAKIFNAFKTSPQYKAISLEEEEISSLNEDQKGDTLAKHNSMRSLKRQLSKKQNPKQK